MSFFLVKNDNQRYVTVLQEAHFLSDLKTKELKNLWIDLYEIAVVFSKFQEVSTVLVWGVELLIVPG
jgi:hypothetical protein